MAEEEQQPKVEETPAATAAAATAAATTEAPSDKEEKPNGKKKYNNKRDETPVEELFDLSKPIPRAEKPNRDEHEAKLNELNAEFEKLKEERRKIQEQIDSMVKGGKGSAIGKEREAMQVLRSKKGKLIDEKRAIRAQLDALRTTADKLVKDRKDTLSSVKFSTPKEIEAEISKLHRLQETTSMSLSDEKRLIKDIDGLKASKEKIKDLTSVDNGLKDVKNKRKAVSDSIAAKDKEIDAVAKDIDVGQAKMREMTEKETDKRGSLDALFKKRDQFKKDIAGILKEKDSNRDEFRETNNKWWNYQRAVKAQKQVQWEAEKAARDEEKKAFLKKQEEEEAKKIPYEEEQGLCDYLANYLERTYVNGGSDDAAKVSVKKEEVIAVKDDPFANFKPVDKNKEEEQYFGKGKSKKKRQRAAKKADAVGPFTLSVDSFEQFGLLGLNPPTSLTEVEKSIKELREKKDWYKNQPRGSVPTAKDIRKSNEKAAAKLRQQVATPAVSAVRSGGKFSLKNDDFAPLGKGASNTLDVSSWGQKLATPSAPPAPADVSADPTPAEQA